jgi:hypothetical protein
MKKEKKQGKKNPTSHAHILRFNRMGEINEEDGTIKHLSKREK